MFDEAKRLQTLAQRGIDMADAALVFEGFTLDAEDTRQDYGEVRMFTVGRLHGRMDAWSRLCGHRDLAPAGLFR